MKNGICYPMSRIEQKISMQKAVMKFPPLTEDVQRKFVLCALHQKVVHRESGLEASEFWLSQMSEHTKTSHGICAPCFIAYYGIDEAISVLGEVAASRARKFVMRSIILKECRDDRAKAEKLRTEEGYE